MLKPTIRLLCWKILNPYNSTWFKHPYVSNIPNTSSVKWPHFKEKVGQLQHAFHIMVVLVCDFNIQTKFEEGAICGCFLSTNLKFGKKNCEKKGISLRSQTYRIPIDLPSSRGRQKREESWANFSKVVLGANFCAAFPWTVMFLLELLNIKCTHKERKWRLLQK